MLAPYLVDRVRFSSKVQAFVGARLDVLDYEDPANATERDDTRFDPMLGLTFSPTHGPRPPRELGHRVRPAVDAGRGAARARGEPAGRGRGEARSPRRQGLRRLALYHLERDDIAIPDSTGLSRQVGDQRSHGVEIDLSVRPSPGWVTTATYAYTDAELTRFSELVPLQPPDFVVVDRSGNRSPFAPRHLFSLWTSKHFARASAWPSACAP